jgi:hypothetical protein
MTSSHVYLAVIVIDALILVGLLAVLVAWWGRR